MSDDGDGARPPAEATPDAPAPAPAPGTAPAPAPKKKGAIARLRELVGKAFRQHTTPRRLAVAVGVGVMIGCSPAYGLHSLIAVGVAALLRLNSVAVLLGSQISVPPVAPLIAYACIRVGAAVLGTSSGITLAAMRAEPLPDLFARFALAWLVGGAFVGLGLATVFGGATYVVARRRQRRAPPQGAEPDADTP